MALQITFSPDGLTPNEAVGLIRLLDSVSPGALAAAAPTKSNIETLTLHMDVDLDDGALQTAATLDAAPTDDPAVAFGNGPLPSGAISAPAPEPVAALAVAGVELDTAGLPWDGRIHAGTKRKNANGTWTAKKGVHADTVALVTGQLRANMGAPAAPVPPVPGAQPVMPASSLPVGTPAVGMPPPSLTGQIAPPIASPSSVPPPPLATPAAAVAPTLTGPQLFGALMAKVTAAQTAGKLTTEQLNAIVAGVGLTATSALMTRSDLIPTVEAEIDALVAAAG